MRRAVDEWIYRRPLKYLRLVRRRGLIPLLEGLRDRGIHRGVFSDYPAADKLEALGVAGHFDLAISAIDRDVAAFKPAPRGFLVACERWHLTPQDVLYVGDRPDVDLAGATAAGMRCAIVGRSGRSADGWMVRNFEELKRVIDSGC